LVKCMLDACPTLVMRHTFAEQKQGRYAERTVLKFTPEFHEAIANGHLDASLNRPWMLPMIYPPLAWDMERKQGGYYALPTRLVKEWGQYKHDYKPSQAAIDAVNAVQATPWQVNAEALAVVSKCVRAGVGPIPYGVVREMPASVSSEVWDKMSQAERSNHKSERESIHSHNNRVEAKQLALIRVINVAEELADEDAIYFPHSLDWRGRMYPLPQDLHPQGDDITKSLLRFATAKTLGASGWKWLLRHTAACWGMDKVGRDEQETWAYLNLARVQATAKSPHTEYDWWGQAEEPWQFLAACIEVTAALEGGACPMDYKCSLPIGVDGSCNGLQHLSAMGLDPVGAKAVNLLPGARQDIYQIVADKVNEATPEDDPWYGHVGRKTVKRAVMTIPYGLTSAGMRNQLLADGFCDGLEGDRAKNASVLRDRIREAIGDTLVKGTTIMEWLQGCASAMASEHNQGLTWETPIGSLVTQSYSTSPTVTVSCLLGRMVVMDASLNKPRVPSKPSKAKHSVSPNIIHSFDASHLMMTVNLAEQQDMDMSYAMIHDSYSCHAADMDVLNACIRDTFVDIYKEDWFAGLMVSFMFDQPEAVVETLSAMVPPERGDLVIEKVRDAEWFFA